MQISYISKNGRPDSKKRRVAAYARVSNGKDAMLSFTIRADYFYSGLIQRNPDWGTPVFTPMKP